MTDLVAFFGTYWKVVYLLFSVVLCAAVWYAFRRFPMSTVAETAAATWGVISFGLLLFFFLGASENAKQFLTLFCFGGLGAALGYLTGVWLAPSSLSEEGRFDKARSIIGTLLAGVLGTKLLSFWDTLTKGESALIQQPEYYLPILSCLVGYFIALASFYTIRSTQEGDVRITALKDRFVSYLSADGKTMLDNGVRPASVIQFTGAAACANDLSVSWELLPATQKIGLEAPAGAIDASGKLTVPDEAWIKQLVDKFQQDALNWQVVATSNQDKSKSAAYPIRFCLSENAPAAGADGKG
jgi:hypothetical protein